MTTIDRTILAGGAAALLVVAVAAWLLVTPGEPAADEAALLFASPDPADATAPTAEAAAPATLVVDVEGGVMQPGIRQLAAGSRVADAIVAAGGYGPRADLEAAAAQINLAQPLSDGQQIYVPVIGEVAAGGPSGGGDGQAGGNAGSGGGLVNLNTATPEELDALPGIGPVTVQKIVAARAERPFTSLDDALARKVIDRGQLEKIRDLATAG